MIMNHSRLFGPHIDFQARHGIPCLLFGGFCHEGVSQLFDRVDRLRLAMYHFERQNESKDLIGNYRPYVTSPP